jgi:hypothetical protein
MLSRFRARPVLKCAAVCVLATLAVATSASALAPQRRGGRGFGFGRPAYSTPWMYDGSFIFCRVAFSQSPYGDGAGWYVDYPRADLNLPFRTGQLTTVPISRDGRGEPNHVVITLNDPHLFECPFVMMTEVGGLWLNDDEAANLRLYLEKGGFVWADDFWGEYAWQAFESQLRKALPASEFPIYDVPLDHAIFHTVYNVKYVPQIPSINFWFGSGFQTSERGRDSAQPHIRAINNVHGNIMMVMTHNTDFGDAFEREGDDRRYFERFAAEGYSFGVNVIVYAMTH